MSRFLRFAVEHALEHPGDRLKEYEAGVEIFDRDPSFDPRVDPLVRVEARRLRSKLEAYYRSDGRQDAVFIEFPRGTYTPVFRRRGQEGSETETPESAEATIAVLPFSNLSPDPRNEYFSDGLTEELIHALTKVPDLRVVAWTSAAQLKGREQDLEGVRDRLRVKYLLRGSVRKDGRRVRINAQLIDTLNGHYLWSEAYDRPLGDLFAIEEEIARQIVQSLKLRIAPHASTSSIARAPGNLKCYNLSLKGRFYWNKRTPDGLKRATRCFEEAIAVDPTSAMPYAGLADVYALKADYGLMHPSKSIPKARMAAMKALDLDPLSAEAYTSLATIRALYDWHWKEAEALYRRALELNPGYATGHHWFALDFLALIGRMEEAQAEIDLAHQMDPLSSVLLEGKGFVAMLQRRYDVALVHYQETLELDSAYYRVHTAMGRVYIQLGVYDQAIAMLNKGRALGGDVPSLLSALGQAHALAGDEKEARKFLALLTAMAKQRYVPSPSFALIHLCLGETNVALRWLEKACKQHELPVCSMKVHPAYDPLRSQPRFQSMLAKIGLADQA
jgi:serine/threonine-protein kinase